MQQYLPFTVLKLNLGYCEQTKTVVELQQYLPFTVLKQSINSRAIVVNLVLQQYLPFTVLKLYNEQLLDHHLGNYVATVLTVYGIETIINSVI